MVAYRNPTRVVFGAGALDQLGEHAHGRVAVVTTPGATRRGLTERVVAILGAGRVVVHDRAEPNPELRSRRRIDRGASRRAHRHDRGGRRWQRDGHRQGAGARAGDARARACATSSGLRKATELAVPVRLVAVPTTAGTGSEVTPFATVWDTAERRKLSVARPALFPEVALVDPTLTVGLDWETTLSCGLDAYVQCFEAICNRNATAVTTALAERGRDACPDALRALRIDPGLLDARRTWPRPRSSQGLRSATREPRSPIRCRIRSPRSSASRTASPVRSSSRRCWSSISRSTTGGSIRSRVGPGWPAPTRSSTRSSSSTRARGRRRRRRGTSTGSTRSATLAPEMLTPARADNNLRPADERRRPGDPAPDRRARRRRGRRMSGLGFLRERRAVKEFESLDRSFREIVFYSEGSGDWPHIGPVVEALLARPRAARSPTSARIPPIPGSRSSHPRLRSFMIGAGHGAHDALRADRLRALRHDAAGPRPALAQAIAAPGALRLSLPLDEQHARRVPRRARSTRTTRSCASVRTTSTRSARRRSATGCGRRSSSSTAASSSTRVLAEVGEPAAPRPTTDEHAEVLVAPSWGDCSLIERPVGTELVDILLEAGYETVLRLHPDDGATAARARRRSSRALRRAARASSSKRT